MRARCKHCGREHEVGTQIGGKLGGMAVGALLGPAAHQMTGSKVVGSLATLAGGLVGAAAGHFFIDDLLIPACPTCGGVLSVLNLAL